VAKFWMKAPGKVVGRGLESLKQKVNNDKIIRSKEEAP
jgi:hypothetical protein